MSFSVQVEMCTVKKAHSKGFNAEAQAKKKNLFNLIQSNLILTSYYNSSLSNMTPVILINIIKLVFSERICKFSLFFEQGLFINMSKREMIIYMCILQIFPFFSLNPPSPHPSTSTSNKEKKIDYRFKKKIMTTTIISK